MLGAEGGNPAVAGQVEPKCCAEGGNRTPMVLPPHDFESCASANSATSAYNLVSLRGLEPLTSSMSTKRSSQLSYRLK